QASHADLVRAQTVAGVGSWRLDIRNNVLLWSDEEYRIFGVTPGTPMTYEGFLACVHPDERATVDREFKAALRGQPYDIEHRILVNGEVRWVRDKADLEFGEDHELIGGIGVSVDITDRKLREEELRRTQERLELAMRGAELGMWDWDITSGQVFFNPRWAEMRGYHHEELQGHVNTWTSGIHPEDRPRVERVLEEHFRGERADYETEHRVRTKSGEWLWILDRGKVFARNERGEPLRMAGTELDITARKRAEEELRLAEAKAAGIVSIAADAIISVDKDQRITLFNEGAEKIFGYSKAEVVGAPLDVLIPERFRAIHKQHVEKFATGEDVSRRMGDSRGTAIFGLRKNGNEFPADAAISKLEVGGERILTVVLRDVAEQKRLEREQRFLAEVGPLLAMTLGYEETLGMIAQLAVRDLADLCVVDIVENGVIRRLKVLAREPAQAWIAEALMRSPFDRGRPHIVGPVAETNKPLLIERVTPDDIASWAQNEERLRALRGLDPTSVLAVPLLAGDRLLGVVALLSSKRPYGPADLQLAEELAYRAALSLENARLYREAQRAVQARDDVLGVVAHDLRNPLNSIVMQASLIRRRTDEPERIAKSADAIERAANRMNRLIQDLLDVVRMEAGRLSLRRDRQNTGQVVSEAIEAQKPLAESTSMALRVDLREDLPDIWVDRDRLLQILENLVGNALKFTEPGGSVIVGAAPQEGCVLFWIADTGIGVAPKDIPHLFDRFWQARKT
ncbi:MAG TPA: PAS domain S-box protein, partial [Polyangiaceae bacterium]